MNQHDLQKLLSDVQAHYQSNIGEHFAKAIGRLIAELPWDEQKRELLTIIAQLVEINNESN